MLLSGSAAGLAALTPPVADFVWAPTSILAGQDVSFVSTAYDADGRILLWRWIVQDDEETQVLFHEGMSRAFQRRGSYEVTHEVTDSTLLVSDVKKIVVVDNTPPVPAIDVESPAFRGQPVSLRGSASDADADEIVDWSWELGDGSTALGQNVSHVYSQLGVHAVTLSARDSGGAEAFRTVQLRVVNAPPRVQATFAPEVPHVAEPVTFQATGVDPDSPGGPLTFEWSFPDGVYYEGQAIVHTFVSSGDHTVVVRARDAEGALSAPLVLAVHVDA